MSEFHNPHFVLLNLAVGGQYTELYTEGSITAQLPSKMYVDYVKLYQNKGDVLNLLADNSKASTDKYGIVTDNTPVNVVLNPASEIKPKKVKKTRSQKNRNNQKPKRGGFVNNK